MRTRASHISLIAFAIVFFATLSFGILGYHHTAQADCVEDPKGGQYCLLEPLPLGDNQTFDKYDSATTSAADYINVIIKVFISIIGVLGVIMIILGGVQYMTTDAISKKEGGKEMIQNSIFGLLLALASWLILNTINPHILDIRIDPPKGDTIKVSGSDDLPAPLVTLTTTINGQNVSVKTRCDQTSVNAVAADQVALDDGKPWGSVKVINDNDAAFRTKLTAVGVNVNKTNCATIGQSGCTTVYKLGDSTVASLGKIRNLVCKSDANCKLTLTGGTECWLHSTHQIGSEKVDLDPAGSPSLDSYIKGVTTKVCDKWIDGQASDGCPTGQAGFYTLGSTVFVRESDHYHVKSW